MLGLRTPLRWLAGGITIAIALSCGGDPVAPGGGAVPDSLALDTPFPDSADAGDTLLVGATLLDTDHQPMAGVIVVFTVQPTGVPTKYFPDSTDADGHATAKLPLAQFPGANPVSVNVAGLSPISGTVHTHPGPVAFMTKTSGDSQHAAPNGAVLLTPTVKVTDRFTNPVPGATITFTAIAGGGSVTGSVGHANANGYAQPTAWYLGAGNNVTNRLRASVGSVADTFVATTNPLPPPVQVGIHDPTQLLLTGDTLVVSASVISTYQIASVHATVGDTGATLTFSAGNGRWNGTIPIGALAEDTLTLTVQATDVFDSVGSATGLIIHDKPPTVTLGGVLPWSVARPDISVNAACHDGGSGGCVTFELRAYYRGAGTNTYYVLANGTDSIAGSYSLSMLDGEEANIWLHAVDGQGLATNSPLIPVVVTTSTHIAPYASRNGRVLDQLGSRTLYLRDDSAYAFVADTQAGTLDSFPVIPGLLHVRESRLFSTGAVLGMEITNALYLRRWSGGAYSDTHVGGYDLRGDLALYNPYPDNDGVIRWQLVPNTTTKFGSGQTGPTDNGLGSNGEFAFYYQTNATPEHAYLVRNDSVIAVPQDSLYQAGPVTDSGNVVYAERHGSAEHLMLWNGDSVTELAFKSTGFASYPPQNYLARGGWIAWTAPDGTGNLQVWRRSPAGVKTQVTFFASGNFLEELGSDGTVVFAGGSPTRRYAVFPGSISPVQIGGHWEGFVRWTPAGMLEFLGRQVFTITP